MTDHADIVREWIGGCLALHGSREDCPACVAYRNANAALDALVAERDEWEVAAKKISGARNRWKKRAEAAEARITELEAALLAWWEPQRHSGRCVCRACTLTRAALADKEGT